MIKLPRRVESPDRDLMLLQDAIHEAFAGIRLPLPLGTPVGIKGSDFEPRWGDLVEVDPTNGAVKIILPPGRLGDVLSIKNVAASTKKITVFAPAGYEIDGRPSKVAICNEYGAVTLAWGHSGPVIMSHYLPPNRGEIYTNGNTSAFALAVTGTWYKVADLDTAGLCRGFTADLTNSHLKSLIDGDVKYNVSVSFSSSSGGATFEVEAGKNNTGPASAGYPNIHFESGDIGVAACHGYMQDVKEGDTLELWMRRASGSGNPTLRDANLTVEHVL